MASKMQTEQTSDFAVVSAPSSKYPRCCLQPGEWLQASSLGGMTGSPLSLNSQVPSAGLKVDNGSGKAEAKAKADPFAAPDNVYADSFLDSLWINLLSSRMAVAVEAEAFNLRGRKERGPGGVAAGEKANTQGGGLTKSAPARTAAPAAAPAAAEEASGMSSPMSRPLGGGMGGGYTYDDYVALATRLQAGAPERQREVVRGVLRSVFPEWFPAFYRTLFPPSKVRLHCYARSLAVSCLLSMRHRCGQSLLRVSRARGSSGSRSQSIERLAASSRWLNPLLEESHHSSPSFWWALLCCPLYLFAFLKPENSGCVPCSCRRSRPRMEARLPP